MSGFDNIDPEQQPNMSDDPLGGLDPMAWLESLAARQGATEGFTTAADLDIPEVDPTTAVIDEPGYTPYELGGGSSKKKEEPAAAAPPPAAPVTPPAPPQPTPVAAAPVTDDPLGGLDPMAWLESLAARQGASAEEFTTAANLEVPEVDPSTFVDTSPGYTPSEVIRSRHKDEPKQPATPAQPPVAPEPEPPVYQEPAVAQETPFDAAQQFDPAAYDPNAYQYDPNAYQQQYDPNQPYDPALYQQYYDPNQPYDPNAYQYDPNAYQQQYDPNQPYDPALYQQYYDPNQPYDPNAYQYDPNAYQQQYDQAQPPVEATPAAAPASDDPLGGLDPMAWLESLAARQGATEGFTTAADLEVPEVDPSTFVDTSPGYTPSEVIRSRHQQPQAAAPEPPAPPPAPPVETPPPAPVAAPAGDDPLGGLDPMAWLESLAARQGATEGFTTAADLQVPEVDPSTFVDTSPGYTPSEVIRSRHQQPQAAAPEPPAPPTPPPAAPEPVSATDDFLASLSQEAGLSGLDDSSDWLNQLATEAGTQATDFLDFTTDSMDSLPGFDLDSMEQTASPAQPEAIPPTHTPEQLMEGIDHLSDEQIAHLQATGQLDPAQELAWLMRQAQKAAQNRVELEAQEDIPVIEDLGPAEAGELPPWLQQGVSIVEKEEASIFTEEIAAPDLGAEVPDWLSGSEAGALDIPGFTPEPVAPATVGAEDLLPEFLNLEEYDPSQDEWAAALDEEHDRNLSGSATDASWFQEAMQQVAQEEDLLAPDAGLPSFELDIEPLAPAPAETADMPDWLSDISLDAAPAATEDASLFDDLPDWLRPAVASTATEEAGSDIDTWLRQEESGASATPAPVTPPPAAPAPAAAAAFNAPPLPPVAAERLSQAQPGTLPTWAASAAPAPAAPRPPVAPPPAPARPAPAPTAPAAARPTPPPPPAPPARPAAVPVPPPPARQRVAVSSEPAPQPRELAIVPADPAYAQYKERLDQNPADSTVRLELARVMRGAGDVENSLRQYETLVEQSANLGEVSDDVLAIITQIPAHPRARRVLGDAYMRQGYLQEALDAYRGALDNL